MTHPKLTVVGAGNVGATAALFAAQRDLGDVVLVDVADGLAAGKALDLTEAAPVLGTSHAITGTTEYGPTAGSALAIVTAGLARKPGMSRDDLLAKNPRSLPRSSSASWRRARTSSSSSSRTPWTP